MPHLERDGVRLYYETHGPTTARPETSHAALLLTPAFSATSEMWLSNMDRLARDRLVILWDVRGHGRSDSPDDPRAYTIRACVDDMAALLDVHDCRRAVFGGLSLGGYVSLAFNVHHAERVAGLLLCDCGPGFRRDDARVEWNTRAAKIARRYDERGLGALSRGPEVRASHHSTARGLAHAARGILAQHDASVIDSLANINVPTLIVVGELDERYVDVGEFMAARIVGSRYAVVEGAGHAVNLDQPDAFADAVVPFLDGIEARRLA